MKITFDGEKVTVSELREKLEGATDEDKKIIEKKLNNRFNVKKAKIERGRPVHGHSTIDDFSFKERFGWPEHLSARDMDEDGLTNLIGAIVKTIVDDMMDYEIILLNKGRDMYHDDMKLPEEVIRHFKQRAEKAKNDLYRPEFSIYLGLIDPDDLVRRIKPEAIRRIREYKTNRAKNARKEKENGRQDENS